jgi:phosphatidylserine/phosphatidylglycerophosphate/cardiolipin synthase-like enzyme
VHAKIGIVDDEWLTLGSANLNEHSMFNDTEVNLICRDAKLVRETRLRLWSEHLQRSRKDVGGDPTRVIDDIWWPLAVEQRRLRESGGAQTHRLSELPHLSRRTRRLLGPVKGLVVDG